jgi:hypothetical protein
MKSPDKTKENKGFVEVVRRMLGTPPKPHNQVSSNKSRKKKK